MHQYYRDSGLTQKELDEYEKKIPERKEETKENKDYQSIQKEEIKAKPKEIIYLPFARVSEIMPGSPALNCGISTKKNLINLIIFKALD